MSNAYETLPSIWQHKLQPSSTYFPPWERILIHVTLLGSLVSLLPLLPRAGGVIWLVTLVKVGHKEFGSFFYLFSPANRQKVCSPKPWVPRSRICPCSRKPAPVRCCPSLGRSGLQPIYLQIKLHLLLSHLTSDKGDILAFQSPHSFCLTL